MSLKIDYQTSRGSQAAVRAGMWVEVLPNLDFSERPLLQGYLFGCLHITKKPAILVFQCLYNCCPRYGNFLFGMWPNILKLAILTMYYWKCCKLWDQIWRSFLETSLTPEFYCNGLKSHSIYLLIEGADSTPRLWELSSIQHIQPFGSLDGANTPTSGWWSMKGM